ncbi:MAG: DUF1080 domain-containing protein [Lentisphaeraceae bacterium]|nr:DUF1080 domain-containing protein [Lentisphaeraceae bacterium]
MIKNLLSLLLFISITMSCAQTADNKWVDLFDGKSLKGWTEKTKENSFHVENGVINGTSISGKGTTFLCSNKEFTDFELQFETKIIDSALNSGVQIRSKTKAAKGKQKYGAVYGPQVEVSARNSDRNNSGNIYGQAWKSWVTPVDSRNFHKHFKVDDWNHFRVLAVGNKITTWINGQEIITTIVPAERHSSNASGFIGLQVHGIKAGTGPFQACWRNIKINEIKKTVLK